MVLLGSGTLSCEEINCCDTSNMETQNIFSNPIIGNVSKYVAIDGEAYFDLESNEYTYSGDTIVVEVKEVSSFGIVIEERLTDSSATMKAVGRGEMAVPQAYTFTLSKDELGWSFGSNNSRIFESRLFFFYKSLSFALSTKLDEREICKSNGLKIDPCTMDGKLNQWKFNEFTFEEIYTRYDDSHYINGNGVLAYGWIFSEEAGIPVTFAVDPATEKWKAWKWIP